MSHKPPTLDQTPQPLDFEAILDRFESAWRGGSRPRIEEYLPSTSDPENSTTARSSTARRELLEELVMLDLWYRWRRADEASGSAGSTGSEDASALPARPLLEDYLDRFVELGQHDQLAVAVIAEEYRVRRRFGAVADKDSYLQRFPSQAPALRKALEDVDRQSVDDTLVGHSATAEEPTPLPLTVPGEPREKAKPAVRDFVGKYRVIAALDEGGQATVYRAVHPTLDKELVIKLGHRAVGERTAEADRLIAEGKLLAELDHPNLARVYDLDLDQGRPYLVMEFVRGRNLRQYAEQHPFSPRQAALLVAKIADALAVAHARGVVHQDLKPTNILIDDNGEPRIIDFGLARFRHGWSESPVESGSIAGTVQYMSPEQARGDAEAVNHRSDIFALGAVFYNLLSGKAPYAGESFASLLDRATRCDFDRAAIHGAGRRMERVCLRALEADPALRYPNAAEMATALRRSARPRWPMALAGGLLALVIVLAVWSSGVLRKPDLPDYVAGPLRHEFPLEFEVVGAIADRPGSVRLTEGRPVVFRVSAGRDCSVGIWHVGGDGQVTQLFPNEYEDDPHLAAGESRTVPGEGNEEAYDIKATATEGREYLHVVASTKSWSVPAGHRHGPYVVYSTLEERQQWQENVRGMVITRDQQQAVAERIVRLIVDPQ